MAGTAGARVQHDVGADVKVPLPMFSGRKWEIKVAAYEVASGDKISEAVRVATIMDHAPDAVKSMLRLSPLEQRRNVDVLKLWIRESSYATPGLFLGSVPMQVSAVNDGGKGKKGNSKTTSGKGKGKDKNKHKISDNNKSKNKNVHSKYNSRVIAYITRSGSTNADCRTRRAHRKMVQLLVFRNRNPRLMV